MKNPKITVTNNTEEYNLKLVLLDTFDSWYPHFIHDLNWSKLNYIISERIKVMKN